MANNRLWWKSPVKVGGESAKAAAERFTADLFDGPLTVRFKSDSEHFYFTDSAWCYRLVGPVEGCWEVYRTDQQSPRGKAYSDARRDYGTLHGEQPREGEVPK